jgi:hypothetical protein
MEEQLQKEENEMETIYIDDMEKIPISEREPEIEYIFRRSSRNLFTIIPPSALLKDNVERERIVDKFIEKCGGVIELAEKLWNERRDGLVLLCRTTGIRIRNMGDIENLLYSPNLNIMFKLQNPWNWTIRKDALLCSHLVYIHHTRNRRQIIYLWDITEPEIYGRRFRLRENYFHSDYELLTKDFTRISSMGLDRDCVLSFRRSKHIDIERVHLFYERLYHILIEYFVEEVKRIRNFYKYGNRMKIIQFRMCARAEMGLGM